MIEICVVPGYFTVKVLAQDLVALAGSVDDGPCTIIISLLNNYAHSACLEHVCNFVARSLTKRRFTTLGVGLMSDAAKAANEPKLLLGSERVASSS